MLNTIDRNISINAKQNKTKHAQLFEIYQKEKDEGKKRNEMRSGNKILI